MCLVKSLPTASCNRPSTARLKYSPEQPCYMMGGDGVAGRLITVAGKAWEQRGSRDRGIKVSICKISRNALYFETNRDLSLSANYQLAVQPLGLLVGYLRIDASNETRRLDHQRYVFITDNWIHQHALNLLAIE